MRAFIISLLCVAAVSAGCGKDSATTTAPTTTTRTSPVTEAFTSNLSVQGSVWRLVSAQQTGTLTATLTTTNQPATVVGFAIGLRNGNLAGCLETKAVIVTAGSAPQLSAQVDAGNYCVKVFDTGSLTTPLTFTVTLTYP